MSFTKLNILPAVIEAKSPMLKLILSCHVKFNSESLSELLTLEMLELTQYSVV